MHLIQNDLEYVDTDVLERIVRYAYLKSYEPFVAKHFTLT
jgi:hypothetical protein